MNTTQLIELLESVEFGASGRPREISISSKEGYYPWPKVTIGGTGDGIAGAEITLDVNGEFWKEESECDTK